MLYRVFLLSLLAGFVTAAYAQDRPPVTFAGGDFDTDKFSVGADFPKMEFSVFDSDAKLRIPDIRKRYVILELVRSVDW